MLLPLATVAGGMLAAASRWGRYDGARPRGVGHLALWRTGVVARCVVGVPRVLVAGTVGRHDSHSTCLRSTRHTKCCLCMRSDELW